MTRCSKWSAASFRPTRIRSSRRRWARPRCRWRTKSTPETFLPSSRSVAFRKAAWITAGGYPEWIDYCEDLIFDLRLREIAAPMIFEPGALVYFRPRPSLNAFYRQYYRYARGDGKADLWRKRHAIRYATYLIAAPLIFLLGWRVNTRCSGCCSCPARWSICASRTAACAVVLAMRRAPDGARHAVEHLRRWRWSR